MQMLNDVTLCCIDCLNHEASLRAIRLSAAQLSFQRVLFLTDRDYALPDIESVRIATIASSGDYSRFVLEKLVEYVTTPFVLLIQWDGYVIDSAAWRDVFKDYDYIGAPWEDGQVGNGGFSWRSRRLLHALRDSRAQSQGPEDEDIGRRFRHWLEKDYGIRFAEPAVAATFSYERVAPPAATLGFHGLFNMHRYVPREELDAFLAMLSPHTLSTPEMTEFGLAYWRRGERDCADRVFTAISRVHPNRADIQFLREKLTMGETSAAETAKRGEVAKLDELLSRGFQHHKANELAAAYQLYLLALMLEPAYAPALHLIGVIAAAGGQLDQAIALFRKAIRIDDAVAAYHTDLADALAAQGKLAEAIAHYRDALRLAPDDLSLRDKLHLAERAARQA